MQSIATLFMLDFLSKIEHLSFLSCTNSYLKFMKIQILVHLVFVNLHEEWGELASNTFALQGPEGMEDFKKSNKQLQKNLH